MALFQSKNPLDNEKTFAWSGVDRNRAKQAGEMRAASQAIVEATLRRQGITVTLIKKKRAARRKAIKLKDLMTFSRQLLAMLRAGVPLVQGFDIVGGSHPNPTLGAILGKIRRDIETGTSTSDALRKYPQQFNALYCDLFEAGEKSGALETILERIADYQEKTYNIRKKIKGALTYPIAVMSVATIVVAVIMIFVVPTFKHIFSSFGATLPLPTLVVIAISNFFVKFWWMIFGGLGAGIYFLVQSVKRSPKVKIAFDRAVLKIPVFGDLMLKGILARWARTFATMFAAGVPMVDALHAVAGAAGNAIYRNATMAVAEEISKGTSLRVAMMETGVFPKVFLQMIEIGESSGSIDSMMMKIADLYEGEVDEITKNLSSLMEPIIISFLGIVIGGLVVALYMPIFKLGNIVK